MAGGFRLMIGAALFGAAKNHPHAVEFGQHLVIQLRVLSNGFFSQLLFAENGIFGPNGVSFFSNLVSGLPGHFLREIGIIVRTDPLAKTA